MFFIQRNLRLKNPEPFKGVPKIGYHPNLTEPRFLHALMVGQSLILFYGAYGFVLQSMDKTNFWTHASFHLLFLRKGRSISNLSGRPMLRRPS
jgi:hypothetical protein